MFPKTIFSSPLPKDHQKPTQGTPYLASTEQLSCPVQSFIGDGEHSMNPPSSSVKLDISYPPYVQKDANIVLRFE
ncbi:hypothetical protein V6N13_115492 [Hibiscus sabdariffa]